MEPGTMAEASQAWEPGLLAHGYRFAFFDGLNRFYVADEAASLAERFPADPVRWDLVRHLHEFGRAPDCTSHPDHALARVLTAGLMARLPRLDPSLLRGLLHQPSSPEGSPALQPEAAAVLQTFLPDGPDIADLASEELGDVLAALCRSDAFLAALGRIAAAYDGGQIMDD
jgi:hypothetical protein